MCDQTRTLIRSLPCPAEYLTRAWCLFELYTAIGEHGTVEIDIILTDTEQRDFVKAMATEGCTFFSHRPLSNIPRSLPRIVCPVDGSANAA